MAASMPIKPAVGPLMTVCSSWQGRAPAGEEVHCTMDRYSVGLKQVLAPQGPSGSPQRARDGSDRARTHLSIGWEAAGVPAQDPRADATGARVCQGVLKTRWAEAWSAVGWLLQVRDGWEQGCGVREICSGLGGGKYLFPLRGYPGNFANLPRLAWHCVAETLGSRARGAMISTILPEGSPFWQVKLQGGLSERSDVRERLHLISA